MSLFLTSGPAEAPELDVSVCLPVYNETGALRKTVLDLKNMMDGLRYSYELIIVDDGSTDNCLDTIRDIPDIRIVHHKRNMGGGIARVTAMRYARGRWILQSDADCTYPVDAVPEMLERLQHADMVVAARKRESATDYHLLRVIMKWILKTLASVLAGHPIPDLNSGMRAYDKKLALKFAYLYPPSHSIMSTITLAFITQRYRVEFVPIDYHPRVGRSSFRPIQDTYNYFVTIVRTIVYFDPLRILMPAVLFFSAIAAVFTLRDLFVFSRINNVTTVFWLVSLLLLVLAILSDQFARLSRQLSHLRPDFFPDEWIYEEKVEKQSQARVRVR